MIDIGYSSKNGYLRPNCTALLILLLSVVTFVPRVVLAEQDISESALLPNRSAIAVNGTESVASSSLMSFDVTDVSIESALQLFAEKANVGLSYKSEILPDRKVSIAIPAGKPHEVLYSILTDTGLVPQLTPNKDVLVIQRPFAGNQQFIQSTVSGVVTDAQTGNPIPGVNILLQETTSGTTTDADGNFELNVPNLEQTLVVSYIGYVSQEVAIDGQEELQIELVSEVTDLDELVVTAFGISRERASITYSAQDVTGDDISRVRETNPINSLSGRVAGMTVNRSSSGPGGSVKVTVRGNSSTTGNQPLYVIDGIPMLNDNSVQPNGIYGGGRDGGDAVSLLNPDNIENISVLKGASATALYGSQGANGVILITTKRGAEGRTSIQISSDTQFNQVSDLPDFQREYGSTQGSETSWGPKLNEKSPDFISEYYRTGVTQTSSVSLSSGNERMQTYFSFANTYSSGIQPNNKLTRNNFNVRQSANFFNQRLNVDANIMMTQQDVKNRAVNGLYFNPLTGLYLFPRSLDFSHYREEYEQYDPGRNLMAQNWHTSRDLQQNPYWIVNRNVNYDNNDRVVGSLSLGFDLLENLRLQSRLSYDKMFNKYEKEVYATTQGTLSHPNGRYILNERNNTQSYADVLAVYDEEFFVDYSLNFLAGASLTNQQIGAGFNADSGTSSSSGLGLTNWFTLGNFNQNTLSQFSGATKEVQSVYSSAQIGYREMVFLDLTARNDWSSTLVNTNSTSFFYPSVGVSAVLSEIFSLPESVDFAKLRASYAEVGNDIPAGITSPQYTISGKSLGNIGIGPAPGVSLESEIQKSYELGAEANFFMNRLGFQFTYYHSNTYNQFIRIPAPSTNPFGYSQYAFNSGDIRNSGIEFVMNIDPVRTNDLAWRTSFNFARNTNEVSGIPEDLDGRVILTGDFSYRYVLQNGKPYGVIEGRPLVRDDQGRIVLNTSGELQRSDWVEVGNANPDFTLGWNNSVNYKSFSLNFLTFARVGGEVMSFTESFLDEYGNSVRTAEARNAGGVDINAVYPDGTPYNGLYDAQNYYSTIGGIAGSSGEYVYDATNISLRELALAYTYSPDSGVVSGITFSVIGRNLFYLYKEAPYDSNVSASTGEGLQGVDVFGIPTTRSVGFNINLNI